ncbi:hypothetical protein [Sphingomonas crocodyli]|uniref:hypothetical protein n=1 Tax=Sphingomonas crocodyli TaxID=1979270 RepID=UPI001F0B72B3|nr:hypothetical protein [Sphingomonas crocodyli]
MRNTIGAILAAGAAIGMASPASAYLFWYTPNFTGGPVTGTEPGIGLPMPKATPAELKAHLLWNMRAGLNVAALQCQFSPILFTVSNYNDLLNKNTVELNAAYKTLGAYFKRTGGPKWQVAFDQYTTKTYNGFSTMHAQLGFCETASRIGSDARKLGRGGLSNLAAERMQEFRNSLVPAGDQIFSRRYFASSAYPMPSFADKCWKKGSLRSECAVVRYSVASSTGGRAN